MNKKFYLVISIIILALIISTIAYIILRTKINDANKNSKKSTNSEILKSYTPSKKVSLSPSPSTKTSLKPTPTNTIASQVSPTTNKPTSEVIYGITLDEDYTSISQVVEAIKALSVKPTIRIVFGKEVPASEYKKLVSEVHKVAYVLGCVYDSTAEKGVSLSQHHSRWVDYVTTLKDYVDIWEVGNEANGEGWMGDDKQLLADKFYNAYKYCKEQNLKTEITPYQFKPGDQSMTMNEWLKKYIPNDMKSGLDYVLVSYYDDDNGGYKWDWKKVIDDLHYIFPNSKLGIGECGFTESHSQGASFNNRVDQYYKMPKLNEYFVGGYFWWYWAEDCVPHQNNLRWSQINNGFKWMQNNY